MVPHRRYCLVLYIFVDVLEIPGPSDMHGLGAKERYLVYRFENHPVVKTPNMDDII